MSQKRAPKRNRSSFAEIPGHSSPSNEYLQPKRSRIEEHAEREEASVRRSSRAPKPKLFDDEYIDTLRSSFDDNEVRGKREKPLSPTGELVSPATCSSQSSSLDSDSSGRRKSSRAPKPKVFDDEFIDSPKSKIDSKTAGKQVIGKKEEESVGVDLNTKQQKIQKNKNERKEKRRSKSTQEEKIAYNVASEKQTTPKGNQKGKKSGVEKLIYSPESHSQESAHYLGQQHSLYSSGIDPDGSPKVRHSSRTPKPKKTFSLIEAASFADGSRGNSDEEIPIRGIPEESLTPKSTSKSSKKHSRKSSIPESQSDFSKLISGRDIHIPLTPEHSKKKGKEKTESNPDEKPKKKSKKSKSDAEQLVSPQAPVLEVIGVETDRKGGKKDGKEKSKKGTTKSIKETTTISGKKNLSGDNVEGPAVNIEKVVKKKSKKKAEGQETLEVVQSPPSGVEKVHSSSSEHAKKSHSKHAKAKHDRPHSETKDQDQHIILKLHLPHSESSTHSHTHKKHKHRHHSSENKTENLPSEGKAKKRKSMGDSASSASEEPHKKVSIKFKGLSSSQPDVEVDVEAPFSPPTAVKTSKEPDIKKKKAKKHSHDGAPPSVPFDEQEHVKVIIKKNKKEVKVVDSGNEKKSLPVEKTPVKEPKAKPKEAKVVTKETEQAKPKSLPKKKSKAGSTPGKSPDKEKKKIVTGYLLFCKSKRSQIAEANPGLAFPQISQKVGETWNSLQDEEKQNWRDKANKIKGKLNINVEKKEDKKHEGVKSTLDVVDMAAHLKLLGESLSLIGVSLMAQRGTEVHGSLSVLLDSILCAICPLTFLTSHIPGIPGVAKEKQVRILDDLAYTMPGLG